MLSRNRGFGARRFAAVSAATSIAVSVLLTVSGVALAAPSKVTVCQYNETLGTYAQAEVGSGGKPNKGQYFPDTALNGRTIYAVGYTNADGVPGYSAAGCDVFQSALVENNGNSTLDVGDLVLLGRRPTKFQPGYAFVAMALTSAAVVSEPFCLRNAIFAGGASWDRESFGDTVFGTVFGGGVSVTYAEVDQIGLPEQYKDSIGTVASPQLVQVRWDPADNAFLDVDLACPSA